MQNIQALRIIASLENRIMSLEKNTSNNNNNIDLSSIEGRLASLEIKTSNNNNNDLVNLTDLNNRLVALESNSSINDINNHITAVENSLNNLENNFNNLSNNSCPPPTDLSSIEGRLLSLENLANDLSIRLASLETKPDLLQRLSALELTVATLNNNN